ncbi:hypothetical protein BJX70DRAFT_372283 [Aspergillus crustosus]
MPALNTPSLRNEPVKHPKYSGIGRTELDPYQTLSKSDCASASTIRQEWITEKDDKGLVPGGFSITSYFRTLQVCSYTGIYSGLLIA